jgi:hypothetical protein
MRGEGDEEGIEQLQAAACERVGMPRTSPSPPLSFPCELVRRPFQSHSYSPVLSSPPSPRLFPPFPPHSQSMATVNTNPRNR